MKSLLADVLLFFRCHPIAAWCAKAERAKSSLSPRPITEKEKELSTELVGETYRKRLAEECKSLDSCLPIELQT
jgi:hypothetical protein